MVHFERPERRRGFFHRKPHRKTTNQPSSAPEISVKNPNQTICIQKPSFTMEEQRIHNLALNGYNLALAEKHYPSLPDPQLIFDYTKEKGFFINNLTWEITLNLANTPDIHLDDEYEQYFYALSLHEMGHYTYCPFDGLTNLKLLAAAVNGGAGKYFAPIVINIFSDLLIDTRTYHIHPDLMKWELEKEVQSAIHQHGCTNISELWKLLTRCYEILWNHKLPILIDYSTIEKQAIAVCKVIQGEGQIEENWEKCVKQMAKILKELIKDSCQMRDFSSNNQGNQQGNKPNRNSTPEQQDQNDPSEKSSDPSEDQEESDELDETPPSSNGQSATQPSNLNPYLTPSGNPFQVPQDVRETFGDLTEIKHPEQMKSGNSNNKVSKGPQQDQLSEGIVEQFAAQTPYSEFASVMSIEGYDNSREIMAMWYRGQTKEILEIQILQKKPGGLLPSYVIPWRLGDPLEDLDIMQTLLVSPVIIPNMTTRKWIKLQGPSSLENKGIPDLMFVLDSSGSMSWEITQKVVKGRYHVALLAAFATYQYALQRGSYVAGINFSSGVRICDWTNDPAQIERLFLNYQGGGTILPNKQMYQLATKAKKPVLIVIVSDLELDNWGQTYETCLELLNHGHKIVGFFIDGNSRILETPDFLTLQSLGAHFFCVTKLDDLVGLVISEVQAVYEDQK